MAVTITVNWKLLGDGGFELSYQVGGPAARPLEVSEPTSEADLRPIDQILPASSSTLAPGLSMPVA